MVTAVIATRDRPALVHRAVQGVVGQDYPGHIECVVVFDRSEPSDVATGELSPNRSVRSIRNVRTPGLAGSRNSGILSARGDFVAFCDDDDEWLSTKIRQQIELVTVEPRLSAVATGIRIRSAGGAHDRLAPARVGFGDFLDSRVTGIHPSALMLRRNDLIGAGGSPGRIGLVDEELPASYGEDYELLLRAARVAAVGTVQDVLVNVDWNRPSFFAEQWNSIADGLAYILAIVPEFAHRPRGLARIEGQVAFAHAAAGRRADAARWSLRALRHDPRQLRAYGALAVSAGVVNASALLTWVQARGRGL
jgi:glycosyltransferase involved in cell wall biosynthesis